jgi:hypothetical protein
MTKKKRQWPDLQQKLDRPWCYYCERDFDDLKILISHQKAKHFKCERCGRRLNTAGGLNVHMSQVHKETLQAVENALPGRQSLDVEIFGMEGVPPNELDAHLQRVTQQHFMEEHERAAQTGNPVRGNQPQGGQPTKRIKLESPDELKRKLQEWKTKKANGTLTSGENTPQQLQQAVQQSPPLSSTPFVTTAPVMYAPPTSAFPMQGSPPAPFAHPYGPPPVFNTPGQQYPVPGAPPYGAPQVFPPNAGYPAPFPGGPVHPYGVSPSPTNLPPRPSQSAGPGVQAPNSAIAASVDQLISEATAPKPADAPAEKPAKEKKVGNLVFSDQFESPEEKMAALPRYQTVF